VTGSFDTPVLFLVFNRPQHTRQSFETIRARRPTRLFIAADGPRAHVTTDRERTQEVRRIATAVDWPCEVSTLFRRTNLGAAVGVSEAITWFFSNVPSGIILEDDCIPHPEFWVHCNALLARYERDDRVMAICGANFQAGASRTKQSHYLSRYAHCWGGATWRSAWQKYDHRLLFNRRRVLEVLARTFWTNPPMILYWYAILKNLRRGKWDAWDYRWYLSIWANGGLSALPDRNLVKNIGFDSDATHTKGNAASLKGNLETQSLDSKLDRLDGKRSFKADLYYEYRHLLWVELARAIRTLARKDDK
jgi:hypothetical protein